MSEYIDKIEIFIYYWAITNTMKRKVVKLGPATLVVSLPSKWTKSHNVSAGDEVEVEEKAGNLILGVGKKGDEKKEITVEIKPENRHNLRHILTHIYRKGYDKITLKGEDIYDDVKKNVKETLLGFELTNSSKDFCVIENLAEPKDQKFEILLRRLFLITKETIEKIIEDVSKNKFDNKDNVIDLNNQHDKFLSFCKRIVYSREDENNLTDWELITSLMKIQHEFFYLYKYMSEKGYKKDEDLLPLLRELKNYFDMFYDAEFKKDLAIVHKIHKLKDRYQYGKCFELLEKGKNGVIYCYIRELFRLIQLGTSPMLTSFVTY